MRRSGSKNRSGRPNRALAEKSGRRAEALAGWFLRLKGYSIVFRRFKTPVGELDLVVRRGRQVIFVEVKMRRRPDQLSDALRSVNRRRIVAAARYFLAAHPALADANLRFDVIFLAPFRFPAHFKGAFDASGQA